MKKLVLVLSILFLISCDKQIENNQFTGIVQKIIDSDNIIVDDKIKIRLYGIDAPDPLQPFGKQSKEILSNMLLGKEVKFDIKYTDKYGNKIAIVYLNDENINELMIKEGWAWWDEKDAKKEIVYRDMQEEARKNKIGIWSKDGNVAPWEYRKETVKELKEEIKEMKKNKKD